MNTGMTTVRVNLGPRAYDIAIGSGLLGTAIDFVAPRCRLSHAFVVTDENVRPYATIVVKSLQSQGARVDLAVLPPGEATKTVASAQQLWQQMLDARADRKTVLVAVSGGVIGDLAGFVAATYARGLQFLQIPTTLLAHVDSSVGGKVGVNLPGAKNMIGSFWQPCGVLIDTDTLTTLPEREYRAGLAEVVKYGVILDAPFFAELEQSVAAIRQRDPATLRGIIARCCRLKADVVEQDEREETGLRAVLNYGHTFCHAIESATGYGRYLHGEAVSMGMVCAARLAERLGRIDASLGQRQRALLEQLGIPTQLPDIDRQELVNLMAHDKKVEHGRLRFVLPSRLGHVELVGDVDPREVLAALQDEAG